MNFRLSQYTVSTACLGFYSNFELQDDSLLRNDLISYVDLEPSYVSCDLQEHSMWRFQIHMWYYYIRAIKPISYVSIPDEVWSHVSHVEIRDDVLSHVTH